MVSCHEGCKFGQLSVVFTLLGYGSGCIFIESSFVFSIPCLLFSEEVEVDIRDVSINLVILFMIGILLVVDSVNHIVELISLSPSFLSLWK